MPLDENGNTVNSNVHFTETYKVNLNLLKFVEKFN